MTMITADRLEPGDHITFSRDLPLTGRVTHVDHGHVGIWLHQTGDMRWLIPADTELFVERTPS